MNRPKLNIRLYFADWILEIIGAIFLILMIAYPLYHFNKLPEVIPSHFNAAGQPDGFSKKSILWILPTIGLFMYVGMFFLNKLPHIFNYPKEITEENAEHQYQIATKMVRTLNTLIAASFFYIIYRTVQTSLNETKGLGTYFLPAFLITIFGTLGIYLYLSLKKKPILFEET